MIIFCSCILILIDKNYVSTKYLLFFHSNLHQNSGFNLPSYANMHRLIRLPTLKGRTIMLKSYVEPPYVVHRLQLIVSCYDSDMELKVE